MKKYSILACICLVSIAVIQAVRMPSWAQSWAPSWTSIKQRITRPITSIGSSVSNMLLIRRLQALDKRAEKRKVGQLGEIGLAAKQAQQASSSRPISRNLFNRSNRTML